MYFFSMLTVRLVDIYDLLEAGQAFSYLPHTFTRAPSTSAMHFCQIHKYRGRADEFLMFSEYGNQNEALKLYAKLSGSQWRIYDKEPSHGFFHAKDFIFKLVKVLDLYFYYPSLMATTTCGQLTARTAPTRTTATRPSRTSGSSSWCSSTSSGRRGVPGSTSCGGTFLPSTKGTLFPMEGAM